MEINVNDIDGRINELTPFEFECLSDLACEMNEPEIAEKHGVQISLVMTAISTIIESLDVADFREAVFHYSVWIDEIEKTMKLTDFVKGIMESKQGLN